MPRSISPVVVILLLALGGCESRTGHQNADQEIIALERVALDSWSQGKTVGYAANADSDMTYFDDIGGQLRIDGLDGIQKYLASLEGQVQPHKYEIVNPKVQLYGDVGILTFQYHPSTLEGKPAPVWKATTVYRFNGAKWRQVHANWSVAKTM